jgi:hypothetical protein
LWGVADHIQGKVKGKAHSQLNHGLVEFCQMARYWLPEWWVELSGFGVPEQSVLFKDWLAQNIHVFGSSHTVSEPTGWTVTVSK